MSDKIRILFLAANPEDVEYQLRLDREFKDIEDKLQSGPHRDWIELIAKWSVDAEALIEILLRYKPHALHFSGHGNQGGALAFEDRSGNTSLLDPSIFARLIKELNENIRLVVLNACYSKDQAQFLTETVDYTIGMNRPILDEAAKVFAATLYQALAYDRSVQSAFNLACLKLDAVKISGSDIPELLVREGADATEPFLSKSNHSANSDDYRDSSGRASKSEMEVEGEEYEAENAHITNVEAAGESGESSFDGDVSARIKIKNLKVQKDLDITNLRKGHR